ncbi:MAG: hypothetical protein ACREKM_08580, partial [Longimicrobiales bacterium]
MRDALLAALVILMPASDVAAQSAVQSAVLPTIDTMSLRAHTRFLADDALAGRATGTRGEHIAAAYIASRLERLGLDGIGAGGDFLLPVPLRAAHIDSATQLVLREPGVDARVFRHGADFVLNTGGAAAFRDFTGSVMFAGPPSQAAAALQDVDLDGRVVAVAGPLGAQALNLIPSWIDAGVTGVMVLVPDSAQFDLYRRSRGDARYFVVANVQDPVWQPALPVVIAGPRLSAALLQGAPAFTGRAVPLGGAVAARVIVHEQALPAANIGAV